MTLAFVPGEVNSSPYSLAQCVWKSHHIIVYGSGNNLIVSSSNIEGNLNGMQTIYLESDPLAVDLNDVNGFIAVAIKNEVHIYSPINEYSSKPKWTHTLTITNEEVKQDDDDDDDEQKSGRVAAAVNGNGTANGGEDTRSYSQCIVSCVKWAVIGSELLVASDKYLSLYHVYDQFGDLKYDQRWFAKQPNHTAHLQITRNASKIVSRDHYDRIIKVWTRCSYGDTTSLFSLTYLEHPRDQYVVDFKWKQIHDEEMSKKTGIDSSMATIKNFGGLGLGVGLGLDNDNDNDILYTLTDDGVLRVWSSDSASGHSKIKRLGQLELSGSNKNTGAEKLASAVIIDNFHLTALKLLIKRYRSSGRGKLYDNLANIVTSNENIELLLAVTETSRVQIYSIVTSASNSNSVRFTRLDDESQEIHLNANCFPKVITPPEPSDLTINTIQSIKYLSTYVQPIIIPDVCAVGNSSVAIVIQDRVKNTIRECYLDFDYLLHQTSNTSLLGTTLINKFSGHTKAIRKLRKSHASLDHSNILISISDFPEHNHIWEPLKLRSGTTTTMTLTKRFQIDCSRGYDSEDTKMVNGGGIWDAVVINDIETEKQPGSAARHHLVGTLEKTGYISLWDCNGLTMDDKPAALVKRLRLEDNEGHYLYTSPRALLLTEISIDGILNDKATKAVRSWCIIAIFDKDLVRSWKVTVTYTKEEVESISLESSTVKSLPLPEDENIHQIEMMDSVLGTSPRNLLSTIDSNGKLRTFAIDTSTLEWIQTSYIHTNVKNVSKIHGASIIHKIAIVDESGYDLTIWDTKNGVLEYEESFKNTSKEQVRDLDWTFIDSNTGNRTKKRTNILNNAIFSVGFSRYVLLYTQLRYDYTNNIPTFGVLKKLDISDYTSHEIGDSIWLNNAYLVIASGNQFFIDDRWVKLGSTSDAYIDSTIRQLLVGYLGKDSRDNNYRRRSLVGHEEDERKEEIIELEISNLVRILNGPLPVYHPQFLIQSLFLNKIELVKDILVRLLKVLRFGGDITWDLEMNLTDELMENESLSESRASGANTPVHSSSKTEYFDVSQLRAGAAGGGDKYSLDTFFEFNQQLSEVLIEKLTKISLPLITRHQQITLITVISCVLEIEKHSSSLDSNGIRFFIGFKLFQMSSKQAKLSMRDINWALHSDNQEMIINAIQDHYKNRMKWKNVKDTGMPWWISDPEKLTTIVERCARNEFGENRDPSGIISLFYLALNKKNVLIGLWKSVVHQEQQKMLKFLSNDFGEKRWKTASLKNAFVLLSKHRYLDAAYFFLLADSIKDCCSVIANKIEDIPLSIAIAKVYDYTRKTSNNSFSFNNGGGEASANGSANGVAVDGSANQSCVPYIIENWILPHALRKGDRWTTSWIFWQLQLKEIAVRSLIESPVAIIKHHKDVFSEACCKNNINNVELDSNSKIFLKDDPVLMIMFNSLRRKNVNLLKGALELSPQEEFNFIVKVSLIYTRMGCDYLALSLVRNWEFVHYDVGKNTIQSGDHSAGTSGGVGADGDDNSLSISQPKLPKSIPSVLVDGSQETKGFGTDSTTKKAIKAQPPPAVAFEEPDMSAFDFGF